VLLNGFDFVFFDSFCKKFHCTAPVGVVGSAVVLLCSAFYSAPSCGCATNEQYGGN
jgi:hypothetical protein